MENTADMLNLFDLHCDTLGVLYRKEKQGADTEPQLDIKKCARSFRSYSQVFAVYSPNDLTPEEAWENFLYTRDKILSHPFPDNVTPYLAIEGGKLLEGKSARLKILKSSGVSILTLVWGGECCIGGAHDTDIGFTDFGRETLCFCLENGIIPDVSHASDKMFWETAEICEKYNKPFIASHSCSRAVRNHSRNLTDKMFTAIAKSGGIVGVSLAPAHLNSSRHAGISDAAGHIEHYLSLGYKNAVALGCDYDGIDAPPEGLEHPEKLYDLKSVLISDGMDKNDISNIFYNNAQAFFDKNNIFPIPHYQDNAKTKARIHKNV